MIAIYEYRGKGLENDILRHREINGFQGRKTGAENEASKNGSKLGWRIKRRNRLFLALLP